MQGSQEVSPSGQPVVLRTLGGLGLFRPGSQGAPLLAPGKPMALLVYLSAVPGRQANREHLLNLLWADREPASARHALRQTVWYLRQRLGEGSIAVRDEQVILIAPVESDRDLFLAAIEAGNAAEATEIYRGDFLPGFAVPGGIAFDQWAEAEGRRLRLLFRHAAESLARESLGQGRFRVARDLARRVRDADPLDEAGWRLVIETCLVQDDRVSAMVEGQRLQQLLGAEERTPEPATQALLRRANAQPEESPRPDEGTLAAELVGREREFAALLTAFQQARSGAWRVASVVAPPGFGKTRLLRDLARRLEAGGSPAVYVRAQPGDRDIPGSYMAEVARQLACRPGARGVSPASAGALVALDPSISSLLLATPDSSTGDEARRRRVVALAELIQSVAVEHPFALLLDDVHWADGYSRDALEHAIPRARGTGVLVVLAARPDGTLPGVEADLDLQLEPLSIEQVDALVCSLGTLPDAPWAHAFAARLESATEGSPLLLLETLQLAIETGWLGLTEGRWTCPDEGVLGALLEGGSALARRIAHLDRSQGWVLLLLALGGAALPAEILASASARDREQMLADLNVLERRGLVSRHHGGWAVAHDEIAGRAEEGASAVQVRAAHEALGRALLQGPAQPSALRAAARHLAAASLETEMVTVATNWIRTARASGDRRSTRLVVAELFGAAGDDVRVRQVLRALPWSARIGRGGWLAAIGVAAAAVVVVLMAVSSGGGGSAPGVLMATWSHEPSGHWRMRARELTAQDIARGSVAVTSFNPTDVLSWDRPEGVLRPGSPSTLATIGTYPDSGGEEVVLATEAGRRFARLTHKRGDDLARSWSPDGRRLVIVTDRWTERSRSDLLVIDPDHPDSALTRLTFDPETRDEAADWSPDGTRIAFVRMSYDSAVHLCLVSADGRGERCLHPAGYAAEDFAGWISPVELAGVFNDSAGRPHILAVNTLDGRTRTVADGVMLERSQVAGWITCYCRRTEAEPFQALILPVAQPDRAVRIQPGEPPPAVFLFAAGAPRSWLERLAIEGADHPVPVDAPYQLRLRGWDAAGRPMGPLAVRWTANDTSVAVVDSLGVIHPRREGRVLVRVTAGGWRSDSAWVTLGSPEVQTVVAEDWQAGIGPRWVSFGSPRPYTTASSGRTVLVPNGDSTWLNGVYLQRRLPTGEGIGAEFDVSVPLTLPEWQEIYLMLVSTDSLDTGGWDLREGRLPISDFQWRECVVRYPAAESKAGHGQLLMIWGLTRMVSAPAAMPGGEWTRVRLQAFPDGRCGLAVNGRAVAMADRQAPAADSMMVMLQSRSYRTTVLVGHVEVWLGVRRDVDWAAVEGAGSEAHRAR